MLLNTEKKAQCNNLEEVATDQCIPDVALKEKSKKTVEDEVESLQQQDQLDQSELEAQIPIAIPSVSQESTNKDE